MIRRIGMVLAVMVAVGVAMLGRADAQSAIYGSQRDGAFGWCSGHPTVEDARDCARLDCMDDGGADCRLVAACGPGGWAAIASDRETVRGACGQPTANAARRAALEACVTDAEDLCSVEAAFLDGAGRAEDADANATFSLAWYTQLVLGALGYDPGPLDGIIGPQTRAAIRSFERDHGLPVSGTPSFDLLTRLVTAFDASESGSGDFAEAGRLAPSGTGGLIGNGSGVIVDRDGHVLTNHHVIESCRELTVAFGGLEGMAADVVEASRGSDLALLAIRNPGSAGVLKPAPFPSGDPPALGTAVVAAGFPLQGLLRDLNVTEGIVSSLSGLRGDDRFVQITAPIQPGSSGGPLLDRAGRVIGLVVAKLDGVLVAQMTGDIPQNVNFAISQEVVRNFLDLAGVRPVLTPDRAPLPTTALARQAQAFTVRVDCFD